MEMLLKINRFSLNLEHFLNSDHVAVEFKIFSVGRKNVSRVGTLDFKRANFKLRKELVSSVPRQLIVEGLGLGVHGDQ